MFAVYIAIDVFLVWEETAEEHDPSLACNARGYNCRGMWCQHLSLLMLSLLPHTLILLVTLNPLYPIIAEGKSRDRDKFSSA